MLASKTGTLFIKRGDNVESTKMIYEMEERFKLQNKMNTLPQIKLLYDQNPTKHNKEKFSKSMFKMKSIN